MTPDDIRQQIELKVVEFLKDKVNGGTMTEERSQQVAQIVLSLLVPGMTFEALYKAIPKLDDTCPEISFIILPYLQEYEIEVTRKAEKSVSDLIHTGKFDAAVDLAQKVIKQDVNLVWQGTGKPTPSPTPS